jgi:perosamine synthetase
LNTIPPAKPFFPRDDIDKLKLDFDRILTSGILTLGDYTNEFEKQFATLIGVRHAIAVNSGTSALEICLRNFELIPADEVIVPTNTFAATCAAVIHAGGKPVLTDVHRNTLTLPEECLKRTITTRSKGVIAVHVGGLVCPAIDAIRELCDQHGLFLLEDAAHAHGAKADDRYAGSLGSAGAFSFYPTKTITTGEGGMITTNDDELATTAKILRDQGKESFSSNKIVKLGYNWRMQEISAAIGILQLRRLNEFVQKRNAIARMYDRAFEDMGLSHVVTPKNYVNNYYKYTYFLPDGIDRTRFKSLCRNRGVTYGGETYWPLLHQQPAFQRYVSDGSSYPTADYVGSRMVCPPMFSQMTEEQAQTVIDVTRAVLLEMRN